MRTRLILTIALAAFVVDGAVSYAGLDYRTRDSASGDWNTEIWQREQTPGQGDWQNVADSPDATDDTALIRSGATVNVVGTDGEAVVGTLTVAAASDAVLNMLHAGVLEIEDSLSIGANGIFRFYADDDETAPILRATDSLEIAGAITIQDPEDADGGAGGQIVAETVNDWVILSGTITAQHGLLDITSDIEVDGTILANASATARRISFTGEIRGGSTGLIEASGNSNARVHFDTGSAFNNAIDLKVDDGARMRFSDTNDYSAGGFSVASGFFDFDSGVSGTFTEDYSH